MVKKEEVCVYVRVYIVVSMYVCDDVYDESNVFT